MPQDVTRELAALVAVVSIALVGTAVILLSLTWKGFEQRFVKLSPAERKGLIRNMLILLCPVLLLITCTTVTGVYWPNLVQAIALLIMLLLVAMGILLTPVVIILRRRKKAPLSHKPDELSLLYSFALSFLTASILCSLSALFGVTPTMLAIVIGPYGPENFNWGRWLLQDGVFFFVCGTYMLGFAYIRERVAHPNSEPG